MLRPMRYSVLGALFGLLALLAATAAAHLLHHAHIPQDMQEVFEMGARYQLLHAVVMLVLGREDDLAARPRWRWACAFFTVGIVLFSGSLYTIALTSNDEWRRLAPLGGLSLLAGWTALLIGLLRHRAATS